MNPHDLLGYIRDVQDHLPSGYKVKHHGKDLTYYYARRTAVSWTDEDQLYLVIQIPIVKHRESLRVFKARSFPVAIGTLNREDY